MLINEINLRRSVRKFKDRAVEAEKIVEMIRAGMQAPSAGNQQPWEFLVLSDKSVLKELSGMCRYSGLLEKAPVAVVVLCRTGGLRFPDFWQQDISAAVQNMLLQAVAEDLGAVWLGVAPVADRMLYVCRSLNLPEGLSPFCIIAAGYPGDGLANRENSRFDPSRIHYDAV